MTSAERQELETRLALRHRFQLEADLATFIREAWKVLQPGRELVWSWHYDLICEYLTLIKQRKLTRLILNVPPRTMKSIQCTVCYPAWEWATNPGRNFLAASYARDLSTEHSIMRRALMESEWYQSKWGSVWQFASDQNVKTQYLNSVKGQMIATSVGASATGKGGDVLLLDDSINPQQASSEAERKSTLSWVDNVWRSRLNDQATGAMIVIEQRTHEEDTTGYLLKSEPGTWQHIKIPLVAEADERWEFPISGRVVERKAGEVLQGNRFSDSVVRNLKLRSRVFATQYQQRPAPDGGEVFKREWWKFVKPQTLPAKFDQIIQSWDCSFKDTDGSDYVVGMVLGRVGSEKYLLDLVKAHMGFTATKQAVKNMTAKWPNSSRKLIEDKANGPAIIDALKKEVSGIVAIEPQGSKYARAEASSADCEAGNVYLPEDAPWVQDFVEELATFPNASHDDQVDAFSQAINWFRMQGQGMLAFYGEKAKQQAEAKQQLEAKRETPKTQRVWSTEIRTIGMGVPIQCDAVRWNDGLSQELQDWAAFLMDAGDKFRAEIAVNEYHRLQEKFTRGVIA